MSGHGNLKYFCPILNKKNQPLDKELPDSSGPLSKIIPLLSIASCISEVTKVLKQVKRSLTKNRYTKLRLAPTHS